MDAKLKELGLMKFASAIKACASDIDTLSFITVEDLISVDSPAALNRAQAKLVVRRLMAVPKPKITKTKAVVLRRQCRTPLTTKSLRQLPTTTPRTKLKREISDGCIKLDNEISEIDSKLKELGICEYASVIKACASDVSTLEFVTVEDLMSEDNGVKPLSESQASFVVDRCTPKKKKLEMNKCIKNSAAKVGVKLTPRQKHEVKITPRKKTTIVTPLAKSHIQRSGVNNSQVTKLTLANTKSNVSKSQVINLSTKNQTPTTKLKSVSNTKLRTVVLKTPTKTPIKKLSVMDRIIQKLGLSQYSAVIKECASEVDTLAYVTECDLMGEEVDGVKLTKAQAEYVVMKLQFFASRRKNCSENEDPNTADFNWDDSLARDLDNLEIIQRETDAEDIYNCLRSPQV